MRFLGLLGILAIFWRLAFASPQASVTSPLVTAADGARVVEIRNDTDQRVTAVFYTVETRGTRGGVFRSETYEDSLQGGWSGVGPHAARSIRLASKDVPVQAFSIGGVLDGGAVFGDPLLASQILEYRRIALSVLEEVIARVDATRQGGQRPGDLVRKSAAEVAASRTVEVPSRPPGDLGADAIRYSKQLHQSINETVINRLAVAIDSNVAIGLLSQYLHDRRDRLWGLGTPQR